MENKEKYLHRIDFQMTLLDLLIDGQVGLNTWE
jgi:hypothetical protein